MYIYIYICAKFDIANRSCIASMCPTHLCPTCSSPCAAGSLEEERTSEVCLGHLGILETCGLLMINSD